ncbi:TetR/AcrR family transcriptional regulator [Salipaludibacillus sp. LMS25]|uniref:TetR/AcrR family transcriptional regulator n=1 Tax=Salipaludibacillus sp. LMS25 TaxID=2924031 RepID=UPI0020D1ACD6|nr:TetR/AcrR family transcriptional regulator [Salipaludibacillus sp. LMS25]UTR15433.1 TetR/AcrR family transcriptional regulator [Salipaludibacillus sp. LMS25]
MDDLRRKKGLETKNRIRISTTTILAREGMSGLSAKKIADEAGISKSNLFHHFQSIDDILIDLFETITSEIGHALSNFKFKSLEEFFHMLGELTLQLSVEKEETFIAMFHYFNIALTNPNYKQRIVKLKQHLIKIFSDYILSIEPISHVTLTNITESIVITLDAFGMHYSLDRNKEKFMNQWKIQSDFYCHYLRNT